jgi:capsular polysaccharide biosynthesis protein
MNKSAISDLFSSQTISPASWLTIVFSLVLACAVGLFIAFIYKRNYRGVM